MYGIQNSFVSSYSFSNEVMDSFSKNFPNEIVLKMLSFLSVIELTKCREVCSNWRKLASDPIVWEALDLRNLFPSIKVFDESDWVTYVDLPSFGLDVTDAPPLNKCQAIPFLKGCLSSLQIEENAGITLLTIPKGLTLNKLMMLAGSPKIGNITMFDNISDCIPRELVDIPVDKTYRIVITNNVFQQSRKLPRNDRIVFVNKVGCETPKMVEATALLVVTFMSSGKRLYNSQDPWTFTICFEQVSAYCDVIVGDVDGIIVGISGRNTLNYVGIAGVLRNF